MQLKGHLTGQHLHASGQGGIQNVHAGFKRFKKALFFSLKHVGHTLGVLGQTGVRRAHELYKVWHQLMKKRRFLTQFVAVANGAADDAPLHIPATFVAGYDPIHHQK